MSEHKDCGPIYGRLLSHCLPYTHGDPWQELPVPDDIHRLPENPDAMISDLRQQFSDADLQEAGVLVMDADMAIQPDPLLCTGNGPVIALRRTPDGDPFELMTDGGTFSGRALAVSASLRDGRVREMIEATDENVLCAATTMAELAVLLSLKIPATLATGLEELGGDYLQQVRDDFQLDPPKPVYDGFLYYEDEGEKKERAPDCLLVGWRLAELSLEKPAGLSEITSHLASVEECLGVPLDQFYTWQPTEKEIKAIEFAMKHAGPEAVRRAILESIQSSTRPLIVRVRSDGLPEDLPTAIQQLSKRLSVQDQERNREWEARAWENIQRLIEEASVASMFKAAEASENPMERSLWMMAATNGQVMYPQALQMLFKASRDVRGKGPAQVSLLPKEAFQQQLQQNDLQLKIFKEIRECRKSPYGTWTRASF